MVLKAALNETMPFGQQRCWAGVSSKPLPLFMPGPANLTIIWAPGPRKEGKAQAGAKMGRRGQGEDGGQHSR